MNASQRRTQAFQMLKGPNLPKPRLAIAIFFVMGTLLYISSQNRSANARQEKEEKTKLSQSLNITSCVNLNPSICLPRIGLGTAALGSNKHSLMKSAIEAGYRLFDTASDTGPWYKSEAAVGKAFRDAILSSEGEEAKEKLRTTLLVTTKLHPADFTPARAEISLRQTFTNLQKPYIHVYLLHYPSCGPKTYTQLCSERDDSEGDYLSIWPTLETYFNKGSIGALGVANLRLDELKALMKKAVVKPAILQTWFDPYHQDWELVRYCKENNIVFQSYSSLGTQWAHRSETNFKNPVLTDHVLVELASKYKKSVPQIILRWLLQEDIFVIPRSNNEEHLKENINLFDFEISLADMKRIRALSK